MSDDRTRAADLADDLAIRCRDDVDPIDSDLILSALRAYGAPPVAPEGLREVEEILRTAIADGCDCQRPCTSDADCGCRHDATRYLATLSAAALAVGEVK